MRKLALALLLFLPASPAHSQRATVGTLQQPDWGVTVMWSGRTWLGTSFVAPEIPVNAIPNGFDFTYVISNATPGLPYRVQIFGWDPFLEAVTGPPILSTEFAPFTNAGIKSRSWSTPLSAGSHYFAALIADIDPAASPLEPFMAVWLVHSRSLFTPDAYTDGAVYGGNSADDLRFLDGGIDRYGLDMRFAAATTYAVPSATVPEPVSIALMGTGLAGLAGVSRRRRKRAEQGWPGPCSRRPGDEDSF